MDKKKVIITSCIIVSAVIAILLIIKVGLDFYQEERIKNATIIVNLKENLNVDFNTGDVHISDFIENINGEIQDDKIIDTTVIGEKEVHFEYINDENIQIPYSFKINVIDSIPPLVWLSDSYSVNVGYEGNITDKILCADNYDDEPKCEIVGEYDLSEAKDYHLTFVAEDSSNNKTEIPFTLHVTKPSTSPSKPSQVTYYPFSDMVEKFKNENTSLGIDVSFWQDDIDFDEVKRAGVEFAYIRIGSKKSSTREYFVDSKFKRNIEGFKSVGIPVGVYFYAYTKDEEEAKSDAEWVVEQLDGASLDLPIAFDFEDWSNYNKYKMSLYRLNKNAEVFIDTVEKSGYKGILYGSLNYLNKMWDVKDKAVWVAHYNTKADYKDKYQFWQFTASGQVPGINGAVDLDIMYK